MHVRARRADAFPPERRLASRLHPRAGARQYRCLDSPPPISLTAIATITSSPDPFPTSLTPCLPQLPASGDWHERGLSGAWSVQAGTAGGCPNNPETWAQNPQFEVRVSAPTTLVAVLSLKATPGNPAAQTTPVCTNLPGTTTSIGGTG